jgi:hypothetical protein
MDYYINYINKNMSFFKKSTSSPVPKVEQTFLDQFPTWSIRHAQKLAQELQGVTLDEKQEAVLIDCLTAAHVVYLIFATPEAITLLLGGYDKVVSTTTFWPQRTKSFFIIASEFIKRSIEKENGAKDAVQKEMENIKAYKKLDPIALYLAYVTMNSISDESKEFSFSPFLVGSFFDIFFRLQSEQLDWFSKEVLKS